MKKYIINWKQDRNDINSVQHIYNYSDFKSFLEFWLFRTSGTFNRFEIKILEE